MTTITEDYVSFETAKLLKEKGFNDELCHMWYNIRKDVGYYLSSVGVKNHLPAPTHQMAMKWLREVHKIFIAINIISHTTVTMEQKYYFFKLFKNRKPYNFPLDYSVKYYPSYEESVEAALKYSLKNLI